MSDSKQDDDLLFGPADDDDELLWSEEPGSSPGDASSVSTEGKSAASDSLQNVSAATRDCATWTVLVVDDEPAVHQVTRLALAGFSVDGVSLDLVHALSAEEAKTHLLDNPQTALVLLDVVMESDSAGLDLVQWIRQDLKNELIRVVLRTGQPGMAPEDSVMTNYDIHDYHSKTDVSARRLRTTVTGGTRAFRDLKALSLQRLGLEKVISATGKLFAPTSVQKLLNGILEQVAALLVPREHALFFLSSDPSLARADAGPVVVAASGRFQSCAGQPLKHVLKTELMGELEETTKPGEWAYLGNDGVFGFDLGMPSMAALYLEDAMSISEWDRQLIALFCSSAAMALCNHRLFEEREELLTAFARFVPQEFIELLGKPDVRELQVGDQRVHDVAVCFLDVQGFTARSEALGPSQIFALLNRIYGVIGPALTKRGAVIDKYMGDGVMVLFPTGAEAALAAAIDVQTAISELNKDFDLKRDPVVMRCTVDVGPVILGTVGHPNRFDTTVISDVTNVAARLQEWARTLDVHILATETCFPKNNHVKSRQVGHLQIRGRRDTVVVREVFRADDMRQEQLESECFQSFRSAVAHRTHGRWLAAIASLGEVLEHCPDDTVCKWMLSECAAELRR